MSSTTNLLRGARDQNAIEGVLTAHPRRPLLPLLGTEPWRRAAANPLVQKLAAPLRERALRELSEPLPVLTDDLYASFSRTGIRLTFEKVYFERRSRLARAVISLLLAAADDPARARLATSAIAKFQDIAREESWSLPAHVNWHNDDKSGKNPLHIDLFCAETANLMAEVLDLLGPEIPAALREEIHGRLHRAIFRNYLDRDFHWMEATHNWNAVCHQGVVGAALSQVDDSSLLAAILHKTRAKLPFFLEGYGPDGGCSEGPGYWGYGFGWFTMLNEQLELRTGGELSLFAGDPRITAMAKYGPRMALSQGHLVNFADGRPSGGLNPALLQYLAARLDDEDCRRAAGEQFARLDRDGIPQDTQRVDVLHLSRWCLRFPAELPAKAEPPADCYLSHLAVLVARGNDQSGRLWEFAAKGGHNAEHHNHNDCGSWILNVGGNRLITEIGAPEYVHAFFGAQRYEFLAARSRGHSVPLINGCEQQAGPEFAAIVLACELRPEEIFLQLELSRCYPPEARCRSAIRSFRWRKEAGELLVTDAFELDAPGSFESAVICETPAQIREDAVEIAAGGVVLGLAPGPDTRLLRQETCAYRAHRGGDCTVNRLAFGPEAPASRGIVSLAITVEAAA